MNVPQDWFLPVMSRTARRPPSLSQSMSRPSEPIGRPLAPGWAELKKPKKMPEPASEWVRANVPEACRGSSRVLGPILSAYQAGSDARVTRPPISPASRPAKCVGLWPKSWTMVGRERGVTRLLKASQCGSWSKDSLFTTVSAATTAFTRISSRIGVTRNMAILRRRTDPPGRKDHLRADAADALGDLLLLREDRAVDRVDGAVVGPVDIGGERAGDGRLDVLAARDFLPVGAHDDVHAALPV